MSIFSVCNCALAHLSHTHTNKDTTYKQPSTMAACETEACSPLVSFNINGFPDRSAGGTGREKTRQIAGGDRFSVELLKYAPYQNAKQLKGSPYFSRRPPDGAALHTVGKTSPSTFIPLLYFSCFPSSLPVFLPSLHVVIFLALCFLFTPLSRFFSPFSVPYSSSHIAFHPLILIFPPSIPSSFHLLPLPPLTSLLSVMKPHNIPLSFFSLPPGPHLFFLPSSLCLLFFFPSFSCVLPQSLLSSSPPLFPSFPLSLFLLSG